MRGVKKNNIKGDIRRTSRLYHDQLGRVGENVMHFNMFYPCVSMFRTYYVILIAFFALFLAQNLKNLSFDGAKKSTFIMSVNWARSPVGVPCTVLNITVLDGFGRGFDVTDFL